MGRPKGSKNKPKTVPADSIPKGKGRIQVPPRKAPKTPPVEAPEPSGVLAWHADVPTPSETPDIYPEATQATTAVCLKLAEEYGAKAIPANVELAIHAIRLAKDLPAALDLKARAEQKMLVSMLAAWGRGTIPGKVTASSIQEKIDAANYWAQVNEDQGNTEQAAKQRARAAKFKADLDDFERKTNK